MVYCLYISKHLCLLSVPFPIDHEYNHNELMGAKLQIVSVF